ncbi:MAG: XTP/dITP diphosphohydrolase [Psychrosphaera sp.]|jgi:XTP/dITP diphosphohydrolase|uniref:dITP/XTP pyrophosphatase n=1 Tax=Psychrosphaera aquimarina TaxID=2044854 RepID=A0ABU3R0H8_9GAMM|nr:MULTISPECIES: RdgB/HAM1 family non-canonical purine NTP pyrophosphatase [Psychrosphaera]MBU2917093.1 RdgB/HAM1 family non-canonical purine NTP pyrophosphatase [Psychrosphaera sp. F3M07]MDU0112925.1 RdgB/HAM1 family non-canonical purine NTP pyrophosphatase [Psychrosphaera aquimarina]
MKDILLASGNKGKVNELKEMLAPLGLNVVPQSEFNVEEVPETGTTFVENAIIKARHASKVTGLPCIADDSGLEVAALNGAPGIYSSRFAGEGATDGTNIDKLLRLLDGVEENKRQARFVCVLVFMRHADDPTPIICQGSWDGVISTQRQGEHGFGYDPVFFQPQLNLAAAQLNPEQKHSLSHRGKALKQLMSQFKELGL